MIIMKAWEATVCIGRRLFQDGILIVLLHIEKMGNVVVVAAHSVYLYNSHIAHSRKDLGSYVSVIALEMRSWKSPLSKTHSFSTH